MPRLLKVMILSAAALLAAGLLCHRGCCSRCGVHAPSASRGQRLQDAPIQVAQKNSPAFQPPPALSMQGKTPSAVTARTEKPAEPLVLKSSTGRKTVLAFRLPDMVFSEEIRHGRKMLKIACPPGGGLTRRRGAPALPVFSAELAVASGRQYRLQLRNPVWEEVPCLPPLPGDGMRKRKYSLPPAEPDPAIYQGGRPYPEEVCRTVETGGIRRVESRRVMLMPMQYLPDRGCMRICRSGELVLETGSPEEELPLPPADDHHDFAALQRRAFLNGDRLTRKAGPPAPELPGRLLLVFPSGWRPALPGFIDWKKQLGFSVAEAIYGNPGLRTPQELQTWIAARPEITHVVLCGDGDRLPPFRKNSTLDPVYHDQVLSDIPYALHGGRDDLYPDVFLSRITADSQSHLKLILQKLQSAEAGLPETDSAWRRMGAFMGSDEGGTGNEDRRVMEAERQKLIRAGIFAPDCPALYDFPGEPVQFYQVENVFQSGTPYFSYLGHGGVDWFVTGTFYGDQAARLTNISRLPLIVAPVCDNGMFLNNLSRNCLAEAFLENPQGGALAFMGSTNLTSWDPPIALIREMSRILIAGRRDGGDRLLTLGAWNCAGVLAGVDYCMAQQEKGEALLFLHEMHLFGDCSQMPRAQALEQAEVRFRLQDDGISGTVSLPGGNALPGVRVRLAFQDGTGSFLLTDSTGAFSLNRPDCRKDFAGLRVMDGLLETWESRPRRLVVRYGEGGGTFWRGQITAVRPEALPPERKFLYWRCSGTGLFSPDLRARSEMEFVMPDEDLELTAVTGIR